MKIKDEYSIRETYVIPNKTKPYLELVEKEFIWINILADGLEVDNHTILSKVADGLPWLFYGGITYICSQDYQKCLEGYYIRNKEVLRPYLLSNCYGSRFNTNNFYVKELYQEFKILKGEGKSNYIMTYMERIEFDCYIDRILDKKIHLTSPQKQC